MGSAQHHLCDIPAKTAQLQSTEEETSENPKLREILQSNRPVLENHQGHKGQGNPLGKVD